MTFINVNIKHSGKTHSVQVDTSASANVFMQSINQVTGIPTDRMKVMVKGGILKDNADMNKLSLKENQAITVIGSAGPLPNWPVTQTVFLEDLSPNEMAQTSGNPPGLLNLGQTCYLNSSLQVLKAMPELEQSLAELHMSVNTPESRLAKALKQLFADMSQTAEAVAPLHLLRSLRNLNQQFSERDSSGSYMQQDADEAWTQLLAVIRNGLPHDDRTSFVDRFLSIEMSKTDTCLETDDEAPTTRQEHALKLACNISITTNFLVSGILDGLDQQVEKYSPSLNRTALYSQKSRLSRLPKYLTVHMVRFYWRRDIQKKAKIMRKVKFPLQLDAIDLITDELRHKIQPINASVKQILKDRDERARVAKRGQSDDQGSTEEMQRRAEQDAVRQLARDNQVEEAGVNPSAIYELCGMITHKGVTADSGHYVGWVRKNDSAADHDQEWLKFDDDKVSEVTTDKIQSMDGGGEDSIAYILLYRSVIN